MTFKEMRTELGYTQRGFAKHYGLTAATVCRWENDGAPEHILLLMEELIRARRTINAFSSISNLTIPVTVSAPPKRRSKKAEADTILNFEVVDEKESSMDTCRDVIEYCQKLFELMPEIVIENEGIRYDHTRDVIILKPNMDDNDDSGKCNLIRSYYQYYENVLGLEADAYAEEAFVSVIADNLALDYSFPTFYKEDRFVKNLKKMKKQYGE